MSVTQRFRTAVADRDAGAVAIIVAICSVLMFGMAALVIDIGQAYAKRRAAQTDADMAALAGASGLPNATTAFDRAYDYLQKNLPSDDSGVPLPLKTAATWTDGVSANGEITISAGNTRIRVVIPNRQVDFGFAAVLPGTGYDHKDVRAWATAEIRSPASSLPFSLAEGADSGLTCLKDTSGGGSAMRAVLLPAAAPAAAKKIPTVTSATPGSAANPLAVAGGESIVVIGTNYDNPAPKVSSVTIAGTPVASFTVNSSKQLTINSSPPHAAGTYSLVVTNADGGSTPFTLTYALRAPTVTAASPGSAAAPLATTGGQSMTVTGDNFTTPAPTAVTVTIGGASVPFTVNSKTQLTVTTTPAHAAGTAPLVVTNADGTSAPFTVNYAAAPAPPVPAVTSISPTSGPDVGGTVVTITGTNFGTTAAALTGVSFGSTAALGFTWVSAIKVTATAPAGSGAVDVRVTTTGGTSAVTPGDVYTYEVGSCTGANGNFAFLDIPRSKAPAPNGANDLVIVNIAGGIDHGWSTFPSVSGIAKNTECDKPLLAGAILDNGGGVDGANCLDVQNGNKTNDVASGFLDGYTKSSPDLDARLDHPASGHATGTIDTRPGLDRDHMTDYLKAGVTLADFTNALNTGTVNPGWVLPEILSCPRFAIVPVLHVTGSFGNGYYPISGFRGVFIDSPAPDYGFLPKGGGTQIQAIKAYAFSLDFLPGIISDGDVGGTVKFLGSGPKIPVLVHDTGDPSY
jgi:Flp pilus assembly protein TadG